ncbi:MAG TPA: DUF2306 domain-containing protein [Kofleriaceae bacterium]
MKRFLLGFVAFLSIAIALVAPGPWLAGLYERAANLPPLADHLLARYETARLVFSIHIVGGGLALLTGPWQLMPRLRQRRPTLHRATGYLYVGAVAFAGAAGLVLGPQAFAGPVAQTGFTMLAAAWLATTALGLRAIRAADRPRHRAWMTRSFALAFAAVSLRIQIPILGALGVSDVLAYQIVAWSSWVPNLLLVHVLARRNSAGDSLVQRRNARVNELCSANPSK